MLTFQTLSETYGLSRRTRELRTEHVLRTFADSLEGTEYGPWHLGLHRFTMIRPFLYWRRETTIQALAFFETHRKLTLEALRCLGSEVSRAIMASLRPNKSWYQEAPLPLDDSENILGLEELWHPEYQRYCEHIYHHLIQVPLYILGSLKAKDYLSQTLANQVERLRDSGLGELTPGYNACVRNAIAHGQVCYGLASVEYVDRKDKCELSAGEFVQLFDSLVDSCHAIIVAIVLFLCRNKAQAEAQGLDRLPLGLRFLLLEGYTTHDGFRLRGALESSLGDGREQLNVYCEISSRARLVQLIETTRLCHDIHAFGLSGYDRLSISLDCGMPVSALVFVRGRPLREAIVSDCSLDACLGELIEPNLLWYDDSALARKLYFWTSEARLIWRRFTWELIGEWRTRGLKILRSKYQIRHIKNTSAHRLPRAEAYVVLNTHALDRDDSLVEIIGHAMRRVRGKWVRPKGIQGETGLARPPVFVVLRLFAHDARIRAFASSSRSDRNLVAIAEWASRFSRLKSFYTSQPDVVDGRLRIVWNMLTEQIGKHMPSADHASDNEEE